MSYTPKESDCILIPYGDGYHLFVIMNDPGSDKDCLLINVSTIYPHRPHDTACELKAGDHYFISHPSYAVYALAECMAASHLSKMVDSGYYSLKEPIQTHIYNKIAEGIYDSEETKPRILKYAQANGIDSYSDP